MPQKLIVLGGPTASGKTKLGVQLCQALGGEVVSADSMQIYRGMDIGTAKPSLAEREGIPHHMLDVADPWEDYSVARYVQEASRCVDDIVARGKIPVIVGGTGLYIEALCRGQVFAEFFPESPHRKALQEEAARIGSLPLWERLHTVDPARAAQLHPNDEKRIIRALEVFLDTGKPLSEHNREKAATPPRYARVMLGLNFASRADLRARIDQRVDEMLEQGLLEELRRLLDAGLSPSSTAMQAIGYKELLGVLTKGESRAAAAEEIKLRSRQYAKRQLTWFRRFSEMHWIIWDKTPDFSSALQNSMCFLQAEGVH